MKTPFVASVSILLILGCQETCPVVSTNASCHLNNPQENTSLFISLRKNDKSCSYWYAISFLFRNSILGENGDIYIDGDRFIVHQVFPNKPFVLFDLTQSKGDTYQVPWLKNGRTINVHVDETYSRNEQAVYQFRFERALVHRPDETETTDVYKPIQDWIDMVFFVTAEDGIIGSYLSAGHCFEMDEECMITPRGDILTGLVESAGLKRVKVSMCGRSGYFELPQDHER